MKKRRKFSGKFKSQVVLEALSKESTMSGLATKYEIHPMQISKWKAEFLKKAPEIFSEKGEKREKREKEKDEQIEELYKKVGLIES
jgi:transposase-like protein